VGGGQWYKNRLGAIQIFAELRKRAEFRDAQFVMAGADFHDEMWDWIESCGVTGAVIEAGRISDDVLDSLYHGALALLFPSLEEGFGWPILEAQACQCLVITTNRPPMTEIAGGGAILIDPEDVEGAAVVIAEQWLRREELIARASRNFANFSPERMARAYCEAYEEALRLQKPVGSQVQYVQNPR
jgi:glycosyltransferase involved in cell wall biosynthesis